MRPSCCYFLRPLWRPTSAWLAAGRVGFLAGAICADAGAALLAEAFLAAVGQEAGAESRVALPHDGQTSSTFDSWTGISFDEPAALRVLLAAADVLVDAVHAFDDRLAGGAIDHEHAALAARRGRRR